MFRRPENKDETNYLKDNTSELKFLINKYDRLFILGTGTSLMGANLSLLNNELTIGISHSASLFLPNILAWVDESFTQFLYEQGYHGFNHQLMSNRAINKNMYKEDPEYRKFINSLDYKFDPSKLKGSLTSVFIFELLKDYVGEIYLLGFDFYPGHIYKETSPGWVSKNLDKARDQHEGYDMTIYNCNKNSNLKCYPFKILEEVING